ncbi:MAG: hypothetical protein R3261_11040 [Alphaproteobacteria bacterium]|nr:hypothetical protein [Alphaproteobacteria bacterium]
MTEPQSLQAFKEAARKLHSAYHLANIGLSQLGESDLLNERGGQRFYTLKESESGGIISELPVALLLQGIKRDGPISQTIALSILSWIYAAWDHKYRKEIANELGVSTKQVVSDVMGDLRTIRHYAAHDIGKPHFDPSKLQCFDWIKPGLLILSSSDMDKIQLKINSMQVRVMS